uniref:Uncharacterized protein n=1 Tax=Oryza nivara TaxID=4536 RepID=A0A0E0IS90_ORYNI
MDGDSNPMVMPARKAGEGWRQHPTKLFKVFLKKPEESVGMQYSDPEGLHNKRPNKVFQTIWKEKPDGTVKRDIKIQKGSTIRGMVPDTPEANSDFGLPWAS